MDKHETSRRLDSVVTREDFADYAALLRAHLEEHPHEWANPNLEMYLSGIMAVLGDNRRDTFQPIDGPRPDQPSWMNLANLLVAGGHYE